MVKGLRSSKISTNFQLIVKERKGIIPPNGYYSVIGGIENLRSFKADIGGRLLLQQYLLTDYGIER